MPRFCSQLFGFTLRSWISPHRLGLIWLAFMIHKILSVSVRSPRCLFILSLSCSEACGSRHDSNPDSLLFPTTVTLQSATTAMATQMAEPTLAERVQALPAELFNRIFEYTLAVDTGPDYIVHVDENYRPPVQLRINAPSSELAKDYYSSNTFEFESDTYRLYKDDNSEKWLCLKWLKSIPMLHRVRIKSIRYPLSAASYRIHWDHMVLIPSFTWVRLQSKSERSLGLDMYDFHTGFYVRPFCECCQQTSRWVNLVQFRVTGGE